MSMTLVTTGLLQALILSFVAYGVMIPFRFLNFADLSAEGAYPLGGALCASLLLSDLHPALTLIASALIAGCLSMIVALIHVRLKVNTLLAGIIVSTMAYSVNLRIMEKPNIALFNKARLFSDTSMTLDGLILLGLLFVMVLPFALFLRTEKGLQLRAIGLNPDFAKSQGISIQKYTLLGLMIAGCYSGFGGALMVQYQSYMDISMGIGIVIHALAALMIGEAITGNATLHRQLLAPFLGAIVYQQIQGLALSMGLAPSDLKFFTGAVVLMVIGARCRRVI